MEARVNYEGECDEEEGHVCNNLMKIQYSVVTLNEARMTNIGGELRTEIVS